MWISRIILFFLLFVNFVFSQKKEVDTIYIYEEVIIRDTVYIERPLNKTKIDKILITPEKKGEPSQITIVQNNKKTLIPVDSIEIQNDKKTFGSNWNFGSKFNLSISSNTLLKEFNADNQLNIGLGLFVKKTLFHNSFSIGTGFEGFITVNPTQLNKSKTNSFLNGYYFNDDGSPRLFNSISSKGFQLQIPFQLYWKIKNFTPSIGIFGNLSNYESEFIGSSGSLPLTLDQIQTYSAKIFFFGYLTQLEYSIFKNWSVGINYSFSNANNIIFQRNKESFSVAKKMTQNSFGLNILYLF